MQAGVVLLNAAIVAAADEGAVGSEDGGADGQAAFGKADAGLGERDGEHGAVVRRLRWRGGGHRPQG